MANKETRLYGYVLEHGAIKEYIFDVIDTGRRVKTIDERPFLPFTHANNISYDIAPPWGDPDHGMYMLSHVRLPEHAVRARFLCNFTEDMKRCQEQIVRDSGYIKCIEASTWYVDSSPSIS